MKKFAEQKLTYRGATAAFGAKTEEYGYGSTTISVSKVRDLVSDTDCVVVAFDRPLGTHLSDRWKATVARYFGVNLNTCSFGPNVVYGRAV